MNTEFMGRLVLSDSEEDALVAFMQTLTDGFMPRRARGPTPYASRATAAVHPAWKK
jgi:hypothetical protein